MDNNGTMAFKVEKSNTVKGVTAGVMILLVVVFAPIFFFSADGPETLIVSVVIAVAVFGSIFGLYLMMPRRIELTADAIVVRRVAGKKVLPYADIYEAEAWSGWPHALLRTCGSGALFGYIGWFAGGGLGRHYEYVGRYSQAFYIKLRSGRPYMLSCQERDKVLERINMNIKKDNEA